MGCEYCEYTNYGEHDCTAPLRYRKNFCDVYFPGEYKEKTNSNYTPSKKKRKKVKRH